MMDQLAGTVTLKEGWRKVLLPDLDLRSKKYPLKSKADEQMPRDKRQRGDKMLDSKERKMINYESSRIKSVVNETNINGRQSVKNLL